MVLRVLSPSYTITRCELASPYFSLCAGKLSVKWPAGLTLTQCLAGLKLPADIKVMEMVKGQQEKQTLRRRKPRIKQAGAIYHREVIFF